MNHSDESALPVVGPVRMPEADAERLINMRRELDEMVCRFNSFAYAKFPGIVKGAWVRTPPTTTADESLPPLSRRREGATTLERAERHAIAEANREDALGWPRREFRVVKRDVDERPWEQSID